MQGAGSCIASSGTDTQPDSLFRSWMRVTTRKFGLVLPFVFSLRLRFRFAADCEGNVPLSGKGDIVVSKDRGDSAEARRGGGIAGPFTHYNTVPTRGRPIGAAGDNPAAQR
jgi:hypothetical protein